MVEEREILLTEMQNYMKFYCRKNDQLKETIVTLSDDLRSKFFVFRERDRHIFDPLIYFPKGWRTKLNAFEL